MPASIACYSLNRITAQETEFPLFPVAGVQLFPTPGTKSSTATSCVDDLWEAIVIVVHKISGS